MDQPTAQPSAFAPASGGTARRGELLGVMLLIAVGRFYCANAAEDFFPIGVWLQHPTNAAKYRAAGFNTYVGLWQGPTAQQLAALQSSGMRVICSQNEVALRHPAHTNIIAWMHEDEPDNSKALGARLGIGSTIPPSQIVADYLRMKARDPVRPVLLNLGQGVAWDGWRGRGRRNNHPEDYAEYVQGCDVASFGIYPVNHASGEVAGNLWILADGLGRLRKYSGGAKPCWTCIESTHITTAGRRPAPAEVRAEVWMALIHGARGIIYFAHQFEPTFVEAALLADQEVLPTITTLNQQISALAGVINSPTVINAVTVQSATAAVPIAMMVKQHGGLTYLFAVAMRPGTNTAKFALSGVAAESVEVIGEHRSLRAEAGLFSDRFGPWEVHLYRVESGGNH